MTAFKPHYTSRFRTVPVIIAINIVIFLCWTLSFAPRGYWGLQGDLDFMSRHFLVSWSRLASGDFWTLISSVFSHNSGLHLFVNMFVLRSFGPVIEQIFSVKKFLLFYLVAGALSSLTHSLTSHYLLHQPALPALGASGAIAGIVALFSLYFPRQKLLILAIIPIPAFWGLLLIVGLDIWGLVAQSQGHGLPIGHGAHLGGALTGLLFYLFRRR